jgi:DNA (cytosine-5)-methyltransferase 1
LNGAQSSAFWGFTRLISGMKERRPALLLIENVTGFLTSNGGADFESAMQALNRLGYDVDPFIIDAAHFVPQSRRRLFVVARRHKSRKLREADYESEVRPNALSRFMVDHPGIRWAIRKLPALPRRTHNLESILEDLPDQAPEWWSEQRANYLLAQMSERHRRIASQMIEKNTWSYGTVFRRVRNAKSMAELRTDGVAGCLRTPRGGSGRQILFKAGKGRYQARLLTSAECARLMGVKHFAVDVPLHQALFGFGDAVCVSVIEWIARHYLNPLYAEMLKGDEVPAAGRRSRILARKERGFPLR